MVGGDDAGGPEHMRRLHDRALGKSAPPVRHTVSHGVPALLYSYVPIGPRSRTNTAKLLRQIDSLVRGIYGVPTAARHYDAMVLRPLITAGMHRKRPNR